jgi:hypothetical protein
LTKKSSNLLAEQLPTSVQKTLPDRCCDSLQLLRKPAIEKDLKKISWLDGRRIASVYMDWVLSRHYDRAHFGAVGNKSLCG